MNLGTFAALPLISAFIGWVTNWLAVKMLFRPRRPVRLFGLVWQGVFPKRQAALAAKIGEIVATELISYSEINADLSAAASAPGFIAGIEAHIQKIILERLPRAIPIISTFVTPLLAASISSLFIEDLKRSLPELIDSLSGELEARLDLRKKVEEKVAGFSTEKLESLLVGLMRREFLWIEILGGVLGFLIGLVQVLLLLQQISLAGLGAALLDVGARMSLQMYLATAAWLLLMLGALNRTRRRIHVPCMLAGIFLDIGLVLYLQFTRHAIQTAAEFKLGFFAQLHIGMSTLALLLYVPVLYFGTRLLLGHREERARHLRFALPALLCRTLGFFLMFSMLK